MRENPFFITLIALRRYQSHFQIAKENCNPHVCMHIAYEHLLLLYIEYVLEKISYKYIKVSNNKSTQSV